MTAGPVREGRGGRRGSIVPGPRTALNHALNIRCDSEKQDFSPEKLNVTPDSLDA